MSRNTSVDSEIGRVKCKVYDKLAAGLKPKEYIYSYSLESSLFLFSGMLSYRNLTSFLNRVFHRPHDVMLRTSTVKDHVEAAGKSIGNDLYDNARRILNAAPGFSEEGIIENKELISPSIAMPAPETGFSLSKVLDIKDTIAAYNLSKDKSDQIVTDNLTGNLEFDPRDCVYISIDDVGVKHQKDSRKGGGSKVGKYVENTVIHAQSREGEYVITTVGMKKAFTILMGYLVGNHLLENRHLYFFSDGAKSIKANIELYFDKLCPYKLILDWYHLEKRVAELLSMALKGPKEVRHDIRYKIDQKLWAGNFDEAINYIKSIDKQYIKNANMITEATDYIQRKASYATCYAVRSLLGYRNSSNPAEKANDLVVANRQKHNGMSWSHDGSGALASITSLVRNQGLDEWITKGSVCFRPIQDINLVA